MNKSIFIGRMATDPKVMSSAGKKTVAYFRIAVERNFKQEGAPNADYFSCVTFGERAEFVAKYFYKGKKIALPDPENLRSLPGTAKEISITNKEQQDMRREILIPCFSYGRNENVRNLFL